MGKIETVQAVMDLVAAYAAVGVIFSIFLLLVGATRIDNGVKNAGFGFRILILPGLIALWPLLLIRWLVGGQPHGDEE
jgi:hypothetical protein